MRAVLALAHLPRSETALDAAQKGSCSKLASPLKRCTWQCSAQLFFARHQLHGTTLSHVVLQGLSDRLTHVFPDKTFARHRLDFASVYVRDCLADRFIATKQRELRTFLISYTADAMEYSVLWGHMFEFYTLSMLSAGTCKSFKRRNLGTGALSNLGLPLTSTLDPILHKVKLVVNVDCCTKSQLALQAPQMKCLWSKATSSPTKMSQRPLR